MKSNKTVFRGYYWYDEIFQFSCLGISIAESYETFSIVKLLNFVSSVLEFRILTIKFDKIIFIEYY